MSCIIQSASSAVHCVLITSTEARAALKLLFEVHYLYSNRLNAKGRDEKKKKNWSGAWKELYCHQAGSQTAGGFCAALFLRNRKVERPLNRQNSHPELFIRRFSFRTLLISTYHKGSGKPIANDCCPRGI